MKVLLAGGGTAGHINPAIAIAQYIKEQQPDAQIMFAGTPKGMEAELVKKAGFAFSPIQISGFKRSLSPSGIAHNCKTLYWVCTSHFAAKKMLKDFRPDVVIGTGGYVSGPVVLAASKMGIYTAIHEQNAFPGVTNKLLAKRVNTVFLAVEEAQKHLEVKGKLVVVGNPIRQSVLTQDRAAARKKLGLDERPCVLSFGGSLGARIINTAAADLMQWNCKTKKLQHIHGYGRLGKENFPAMLEERGLSLETLSKREQYPFVRVSEYIDDMDVCLAAADLVICRSGAITLSELQATGTASLLIPSPYVAENHQYHNAMVLVEHGAALLIQEADYKGEEFMAQILALVDDPEKLRSLGKEASRLAILDTTQRIYQQIMQDIG